MKNVTAAILVKDNLILIAKRRATDTLAGLWEFPGGKIEPGESPEECLKREMMEEFNIEVTVKDFFAGNLYHYENGTINLLTYWASWIGGQFTVNDHDDYRWVTVDQLKEFDFLPADIPIVKKLAEDKTFKFIKIP